MNSAQIIDLGSLTEIKTGRLDANASVDHGEYPFFTCSKEPLRIDRYSFDGDYVLVAGNGDLNVKHYIGKFDAYQRTYAIKSDKQKLDSRYLFYFLSKYIDVLRNQSIGGVIKYIKISNLTDAKIPLPPLAEQQKIAAILDAADSLRQKDQQLVEHYTSLSQSLFLEMFGDPVTNPMGWGFNTLNEVVTKLGDGLHGTPTYSDDGDYYFVNGNNLQHGSIVFTNSTKKVNQDEYDKYKKDLNKSTMLVSINGSIGNVAYYEDQKIVLGKSACYFNVNESLINKTFLYNLIESKYFFRYAMGQATGSTIKNVSLKTMRGFPIPMIPLTLQNTFEDRIKLIEAQKQKTQVNLEKSEALFSSLLHSAFTGALTENMAA